MDNFYILKKSHCCGCGVCSYVCPMEAIMMCEDKEGFKYPQIDNNKCIKCNRCKMACIVLNRSSLGKM